MLKGLILEAKTWCSGITARCYGALHAFTPLSKMREPSQDAAAHTNDTQETPRYLLDYASFKIDEPLRLAMLRETLERAEQAAKTYPHVKQGYEEKIEAACQEAGRHLEGSLERIRAEARAEDLGERLAELTHQVESIPRLRKTIGEREDTELRHLAEAREHYTSNGEHSPDFTEEAVRLQTERRSFINEYNVKAQTTPAACESFIEATNRLQNFDEEIRDAERLAAAEKIETARMVFERHAEPPAHEKTAMGDILPFQKTPKPAANMPVPVSHDIPVTAVPQNSL